MTYKIVNKDGVYTVYLYDIIDDIEVQYKVIKDFTCEADAIAYAKRHGTF